MMSCDSVFYLMTAFVQRDITPPVPRPMNETEVSQKVSIHEMTNPIG